MATVSVGDFKVIMEPQVVLNSNAGGDPRKDFNFDVDQDLSPSKNSILVYNVFMDETQSESLVYKININGEEQLAKRIHPPHNGTHHEVFASGVLDPGTNNVELFIDSGTGEIHFGDILIHYQRDITI
jgi:hypothetical protein